MNFASGEDCNFMYGVIIYYLKNQNKNQSIAL